MTPERPRTGAARLSRRRLIALGGVLLVLYVGLIVATLVDDPVGDAADDVAAPPGGVLVVLTVRDVDPLAGTVTVDVSLRLGEELVDPAVTIGPNRAPARDVTFTLAPTAAGTALRFPAGEPASVRREELLTTSGQIRDWPFDAYRGQFVTIATAGTDPDPLPITVLLEGEVEGWHLSASVATPDADGPDLGITGGVLTQDPEGAVFDFGYRRSVGVVLFGLAVVLVLVALAAQVCFVVVAVVSGRRRFDTAFLPWVAAVLFAVVPIRQFLPGSPPPGSWVDVLVVLWVLVALTAATSLEVVSWWRAGRPGAEPPEPAPERAPDGRTSGADRGGAG